MVPEPSSMVHLQNATVESVDETVPNLEQISISVEERITQKSRTNQTKPILHFEWFHKLGTLSVEFEQQTRLRVGQFDRLQWLDYLLDNVEEQVSDLFAMVQPVGDVDDVT